MKYKLRKGLIEAIHFKDLADLSNVQYFFDAVKDGNRFIYHDAYDQYYVVTNKGSKVLKLGNYIVRKMDGTYRIYSEKDFDEKYEGVTE